MYFGSVRFFKHLIITTILLMIIVPTVLAIVFGIGKNQSDEQVRELSAENTALTALLQNYTGEDELTAEELYRVMEGLGMDPAELVNVIYNRNKAAFADIIDKWRTEELALDVTEDMDTEQTQPDTATDTVEASTAPDSNYTSPYSDLYPELYAEQAAADYTDDSNTIYLTFDGGPSEYTLNLLDILDRHDIKATFFLTPQDTEESFSLMNEIADRGHTIGVYSYSADYEAIYADAESYLSDFSQARKLIYDATGIQCRYFRFPGGSSNEYNAEIMDELAEEMRRRGFVCFDWNVDSGDADGANWTTMYNSVLNEVAMVDRAVILMHDGIYNTTLVLEDVINALLADARNFTFSAVTDEVRPLQF